jgi:hypothetical protein
MQRETDQPTEHKNSPQKTLTDYSHLTYDQSETGKL